jgi:hypothetical protein
LNEAELFFVGQLFEKEARLLGNREAAAEEIQRVLPEVDDRLRELPPAPEATPSQSFINRAEGIASEISEDDIRQLFARLVAGEISRPGSISLRMLEAVRSIDARIARAFDKICRFVMSGDAVIREGDVAKFLDGRGINYEARTELEDAGLIQVIGGLDFQTGGQYVLRYGQRRLRLKIEREEKYFPTVFIPTYRLTRIGRELASVLPFNPEDDYFDLVCAAIAAKVGDRGIVEHAAAGSGKWTRVDTTKAG